MTTKKRYLITDPTGCTLFDFNRYSKDKLQNNIGKKIDLDPGVHGICKLNEYTEIVLNDIQAPIHWCDGYTFHEVSALVVPERRSDDSSWKYGFVYTMYKGKTTVELYSSIQEKVMNGQIVPPKLVMSPTTGKVGSITLWEIWPKYCGPSKFGEDHAGLDIGNSAYSKVYCVVEGKILYLEDSKKFDGAVVNAVHVDDKNGHEVIYKHVKPDMSLFLGKEVHIGDVLGTLDQSGKAVKKWTGWHLHFEVRKNGDDINPAVYLLDVQPGLKIDFPLKDGKIVPTRDYFKEINPDLYSKYCK